MGTATRSESEKPRVYFTIAELMLRWNVSRSTVHRLARDGRLKKSRIRGAVRFSGAAVAAFEIKT